MNFGQTRRITMAKRPVFFVNDVAPFFSEETIAFEFFTGLASTQKEKSVKSMHAAIDKQYCGRKILEVSRYSNQETGRALSAFNLRFIYKGVKATVETVFQSSKVFERGGPYVDLLYGTSINAKKDVRLSNSGNLIEFNLLGEKFPIEPKTLFYDWVYLNALVQNRNLLENLMEYDGFTDIAFNPKKSINCQARSVAIGVSLSKKGILYDALSNREIFKNIIYASEHAIEFGEQIKLFD